MSLAIAPLTPRAPAFIPYSLTPILEREGLTPGQRLAVVYALTLPPKEGTEHHIYFGIANIARLAGVDRETVTAAKMKLRDACLIALVEPRREIGPNNWLPELWDFGALVEEMRAK